MATYRICYRCHRDMAPKDMRLCDDCLANDPERAARNAYMRDYFRNRRADPAIRERAKAQHKAARAGRDAGVERSKARERMARWRSVPENAAILKRRQQQLSREIIAAYGNACACCGEMRFEFLTIDHINGGGRAHVAQIKNFYSWLKRNSFPQEEFRCLCMNCNFSRGRYGYCPHERERK